MTCHKGYVCPIHRIMTLCNYAIIVQLKFYYLANQILHQQYLLQFLDDFNPIIKNCEEYNGLGSDMMEQAKKLEAEFVELCSKHLPDDTDYSRLEKIPSDAPRSLKNPPGAIIQNRKKNQISPFPQWLVKMTRIGLVTPPHTIDER